MLKTYLYLPEVLKNRIDWTARVKGQAKAQVIREALEKGLEEIQPKSKSATGLLKLTKLAQSLNVKGPADGSTKHNQYLYDE